MSDLGKYELEDIVWESSDNDDHIVPYARDKKSGYANERNSFSGPGNELKCVERKEEASFNTVKDDKSTMLEKRSWIHSSHGGFPASLDGDAKRKNLCSVYDGEKMPLPCLRSSDVEAADNETCADEPELGNQAVGVKNNPKDYQLNDASCIENDLAFLGNETGDKGSDDLSFYGWPELENFEDLDNMFRDCDLAFPLDMDNNVDMSWFSSSHTMEDSNDALKSGFDLSGCHPCNINSAIEQQEVFGLSNKDMAVNENNKELTPARFEGDSHKFVSDKCSTVMESCADGSGCIHPSDSQSQVQLHVSPSNHPKSSQGKRKDRTSENGLSFIQLDKLNEVGEEKHLLNSQHNFSPENNQQWEINHQPCLETPKTVIKPNNHPSDHVLSSLTSSIIKSELGALPKISPAESSHASNQMKSTESSHDVSFKNSTCSDNKKKGKSNHRRLFRQAEKSNSRVQRIGSETFCANKTIPCGENEAEGLSEIDDGEIGFPKKLDTSTIQEGSCTSSVIDEVTIDASSLKQLQHVMGRLDIRTKLCIRDSLYRLARSAAQRHKCDIPGSGGDDKDANGALLSGTNKCTGYIDMETDTNPIDRSIAHLLFHRPSDPSTFAAPVDAVAVKSHMMVEAPKTSTAEKPASRQETDENATKQRN